jgi:hypothetical protein
MLSRHYLICITTSKSGSKLVQIWEVGTLLGWQLSALATQYAAFVQRDNELAKQNL